MENAIVSMNQFASAPATIAKKNTAFQEEYGLRLRRDRPKFSRALFRYCHKQRFYFSMPARPSVGFMA
jgi:hypothetical protein